PQPAQEQQQQNDAGQTAAVAEGGTAAAIAGGGGAAAAITAGGGKAAAGAAGKPLRVYVYELPPQFNSWQMQHSPYIDHPEALWFWERLLASRHRTIDPREADFFYVPLLIR
ncbi:unnamed protein product, partial [Closterium sp. NIES-53]